MELVKSIEYVEQAHAHFCVYAAKTYTFRRMLSRFVFYGDLWTN